MLDGKVHGNAEKLMKGFTDSKGKALPNTKRMLFVSTTEASERATKAKVQGIGNINTTEICYMVTKETLDVPIKRHLHSAGTNASDTLGPFDRPGGKELWLLRHRGKSSFFTAAPWSWLEARWRVTWVRQRTQVQQQTIMCLSHIMVSQVPSMRRCSTATAWLPHGTSHALIQSRRWLQPGSGSHTLA